jgi:hypothetical protein
MPATATEKARSGAAQAQAKGNAVAADLKAKVRRQHDAAALYTLLSSRHRALSALGTPS